MDTLGLILRVVVHAADIQGRDGARLVFRYIKRYFLKLKVIWADGAYAGGLVEWAKKTHGWKIDIIKRSDTRRKGFYVLPKRWIVERTFGWFENYRRLSKDYEYDPKTSETMIYIAMTHLMIRRLAR